MPTFQVAHIKQQGVDLIIIPLDSSFDSKPRADQDAVIRELQQRASAAGLRGTVVPVWENSSGRMSFIAPKNWHPFFQSLSLADVAMNINRKLYW